MAETTISWTNATWNPLTGCAKISPGCKNCYAERMAKRLQAMGQPNYANGFGLTLHPHMLEYPLKWKRPRMIFVNSMSDLFHKDVPLDYIQQVFDVMRRASWHTFQVLTKRAERLEELSPLIDWPKNVWMGVSIEAQQWVYRKNHLENTGAAVKFLSCEPLLGPLDLDLLGSSIGWVIVGGESGPGCRPMNPDWVRQTREECQRSSVPFFFKQWGGHKKIDGVAGGCELDGRRWHEFPGVTK